MIISQYSARLGLVDYLDMIMFKKYSSIVFMVNGIVLKVSLKTFQIKPPTLREYAKTKLD